jgi:hypothetical protein
VLRLQHGAQAGGSVIARPAAGACLVFLVACAAARPSAVPAAPPASSDHDQIQQLSDEIAAQQVQLGLPANATPMAAAPEAPQTCQRSPSETCTQTCTLTDAICSNASKICDLAGKLGNDAWATQKCEDAKTTCSAATKRCCDCS